MDILDRDPLGIFRGEDGRLAVGARVTAYWNNGGYHYQARARVIRLDARSVTVALREPVGQHGEYPVGSRIRIPRFVDNAEWTSQNCVRLGKSPGFARI